MCSATPLPDRNNLRTRLRHDTQIEHQRLDACVSQMDLTTVGGLRAFLQMQALALPALLKISDTAHCVPMMRALLHAARSDLVTLAHKDMPPAHPLAIDYVVSGSRLGSTILKKRWQSASDPAVHAANAYFSAPDYLACWKTFCATSATIDASAALSDRVIADAAALLDFYRRCALAAMDYEKDCYV